MLSRTDADAVRSQNRQLVLDHFRRFGVSTRRRLSETTGLSLSSTSSIASDLVRAGILRELDPAEAPPRRGRPEVSLELCGRQASIAAVRIAVGEIAVETVDYAGRILASLRREFDLSGVSADVLVAAVLLLLEDERLGLPEGAGPLQQVVVCVQGVTDSTDRRILWSPILALRDVDIAGPIEAATGAPTRIVNDCGAMPERFRWDNAFEFQHFATLFVGFGVGMGLTLSGRTFRGSHSSAVEFGHINHIPGGALCRCGNRGCVEAYAADYAIWRAARGGPSDVPGHRVGDADLRALAAAARFGETAAVEAFRQAGEALGYGLGRLFALIDPLPIVFLGSGAEAMDLIEPAMRQAIAASALGGMSGDVAFHVEPDVYRVTLDAATTLALTAIDTGLSRAPSESSGVVAIA